MDQQRFWHNFRTGQTDVREFPKSDSEVSDYLPQQPAIWNIYVCYRELGEDIPTAVAKTLSHYIDKFPVLTDGDGQEAHGD